MIARAVDASGVVADLMAITKPRINGLVLCTTAGGMALACGRPGAATVALALAGTALTVGGASALNCYLERDVDARMARTRGRPLPAGRLDPQIALGFGLALAALGLGVLALGTPLVTAVLGLIALGTYVLVYTPLKRHTSLAAVVGAVPGALPPLMGWTAATGSIDAPGLALFAILFVWQLPHFFALALVYREDFAAGGLKVLPNTHGEVLTRRLIVPLAAAMAPVAALPYLLGVAGRGYLAGAVVLGTAFAVACAVGLRPGAGRSGERVAFGSSIAYLALLFAVLIADRAA